MDDIGTGGKIQKSRSNRVTRQNMETYELFRYTYKDMNLLIEAGQAVPLLFFTVRISERADTSAY